MNHLNQCCRVAGVSRDSVLKLNRGWRGRKWPSGENRLDLSAKFARGTSHGRLVSMLFALFRRSVLQSRCVTLRLSGPIESLLQELQGISVTGLHLKSVARTESVSATFAAERFFRFAQQQRHNQ